MLKADDDEDHARLMQAIEAMKALHAGQVSPVAPAVTEDETALKLGELLEKFLLLRKHLTQATAIDYRNCVDELSKFLKNPAITRISQSDLTRYQEFLSGKGNSARTIDKKIGTIRALLNFGIKQGYTRKENPAQNRALLTKKQRLKSGYAIFEIEEIRRLLESDFFKEQKIKDPDYTNAVILGLYKDRCITC